MSGVERRGIVIETIGDNASYVRSAASTMATNTKLDASFRTVGVSADRSAALQVAAAIKASKAQRATALEMQAAVNRLPAGVERDAAQVAATAQMDRYNRSIGVVTSSTGRLSSASSGADREIGKVTRGALAGSGVFTGLGRSLAFASGGFLAFAGVTTGIRDALQRAEDLKKAQEGLDVAIEHTGGSLRTLEPRYAAVAKRAAQFGIDEADSTTALERATVLTGDAASAQRAYEEALVISKATGKDFNAVLTATAKGQEGITTSLQRYGIEIKKGTPGQQQYLAVMSRFDGQAQANTSSVDRFNATLANSEEIVGEALLPTLSKYLGELGDWLQRMDQSGKLQRDVSNDAKDAASVLHVLGGVVSGVDKVTGSFTRTLEVLAAFKLASMIRGWIGSLELLATKWGLVRTAAIEAEGAEAAAAGGTTGAGGAGLAKLLGGAGTGAAIARSGGVAERAGQYTATGTAAAGAARAGILSSIAGAVAGLFTIGGAGVETQGSGGLRVDSQGFAEMKFNGRWYRGNFVGIPGSSAITLPGFRNPGQLVNPLPGTLQLPQGLAGSPTSTSTAGPFGDAQAQKQFTQQFQLTALEQLDAAEAALTRSTGDDVAAAKQVVARIKKLMDEGRLHGTALLDALQLEASAYSTIWSAEDAAAQKRAQQAAAAKARLQAEIENSIDPLRLEVALSRAQALGQPLLPYLKELRAAAEKALASGRLSLAQQKEAYDQITSLNQQIKEAAANSTVTFTAPLKLQLALAKDQALGVSDTSDLVKLKRLILEFIKKHKHNTAALIDAYNQLGQVNQELGSTAQSALGLFKQASTKALSQGLGLTADEQRRLRQRLSQLGPGRTRPGSGVGAGGYAIDADTGRPIILKLDGKTVARSTTKHQQRHRRRNSRQRRGPHAGG